MNRKKNTPFLTRKRDSVNRANRSLVPLENRKNAKGETICGAKTRKGIPCPQTRVMPNGRCRMHGGASPTGFDNPKTITGRYSKDLPTRMLARFRQSLQDPDLLSTREDIALLQGMILERLAEIQQAQAQPDLDEVVTKIEFINANWRSWDWTRAERELTALTEAITLRRNEREALREVRELLKEKAHLMAQESKRLTELEQTMTVEQVILLAQSLVGIVREALMDIPDSNDRLRIIAAEFRTVMSIKEPNKN